MKSWYLLHSQIHNFQRVIARIESFGIETYYPVETRISRRKDCNGQRITQKPLFPGYLFLSFDPKEIHTTKITDIPGVNRFIRFGNNPCIIHEDVIAALKCAAI
ncbi:transcription termination/antitermination NusG family protein, partial [Xenorhabdus sp. PR6a]|uniref:transcription termination/antitermination NusG family protein n=1 Tax=Xenorhabdus sp. PR6a TaxID=3025877 RepID=UPI002358B712